MTAEIAIFNREGVALAADSAVTISIAWRGREKVYRSAQKIFTLQPGLPVAMMVYGNTSLMGIPWETIFAGFSARVGSRRFDTLAEYAADLFTHCGEYVEHVEEGMLDAVVHDLLGAATACFLQRVDEAAGFVAGEPDDPDAVELNMMRLEAHAVEEGLNEAPAVFGLDEATLARVERSRRAHVAEVMKGLAPPKSSQAAVRKLLNQFTRGALSRNLEALSNPRTSGVIIAGFGEREIFPVVHVYELNGLLGPTGPARALDIASDRDTPDGPKTPFSPSIYAFAQNRMVRTFFEGIDPLLAGAIHRQLQELMMGMAALAGSLVEGSGASAASVEGALQDHAVTHSHLFMNWLAQHCDEVYGDPVIEMLAVLPRAELASLAEAMVRLQGLKQRVSLATESVSGPVDVLLISKAEGLVWVKRKGGERA